MALRDRYCNVAWRLLRCIVDLFCGGGGFSLGAHHAGFHTALAIDIDKKLTSSFEQNFPKVTLLHADISAISAQEITKKADLKKGELAWVIGGPPCQPRLNFLAVGLLVKPIGFVSWIPGLQCRSLSSLRSRTQSLCFCTDRRHAPDLCRFDEIVSGYVDSPCSAIS